MPEGATAGELVIESGAQASESWACDIGVLRGRQPASGGQPRRRHVRQHLHDLQRIARAEGSGRGLQDRPELQHQAVHQRPDERHRARLRPRGHALHLQPLRRHRLPGHAERQHVRLRRRHGRRHRHRVRRRAATSTSATAAARFSRSAPTVRFLSSPRWSRPSPPITWPSARTATCTSPAPPLPASMRSTASRTRRSGVFYRGLGRPQGMAFDEEGNLTSRPRSPDARAWCASTPDRHADLFLSGPGIVGPGVHAVAGPGRGHHQRALPRRCRASRAARSSDERRNHRSRLARC